MRPSTVFERDGRVYVVIYGEEDKNHRRIDPHANSPKYHDNMSYAEVHRLMKMSIPRDKWVTSAYVIRDTNVPYSRGTVTNKLKNIKGIENKLVDGSRMFRRIVRDLSAEKR